MNEFGFVTKGDKQFFPGLLALVGSLRRRGSEPIFVFDSGLSPEQVTMLLDVGCEVSPMHLRHHARPASLDGTHYNDSIFALMHIPDLPIDRFIHLDADTVVFDEISEMVDLLDDHDFVGVPDHPPLTVHENVCQDEEDDLIESLFGRRHDLAAPGVNAGVFGATMTCFARMREVMQVAYDSPLSLPRRDQSLLNIAKSVVRPQTAMMDVRYNFRHWFRRAPHVTWTEIRTSRSIEQPYFHGQPIAVMHYIGPSKPWDPGFDKESAAYRLWHQFRAIQ